MNSALDDDDEEELPQLPGALAAAPDDETKPPVGPPAPAATDMSGAQAPMNPTVQDYLMKKYGLGQYSDEARQKLVAENSKPDVGQIIGTALSGLGSSIARQDPTQGIQAITQAKQAERQGRLSQFDQGRAEKIANIGLKEKMDQEDPNSEASQRLRSTLKANFPNIADKYGDSFDKLSAADAKNVFQVAETKAKLDEAHSKNEIAKATREAVLQQKMSAEDAKDAEKMSEVLSKGWTARAGNAGNVQGKITAAEAAEKLIEQAKTQPNGLDSRQVEELAEATSRLLGGGGAQASARVNALVPHTFFGKAQSLGEYMTNRPWGQGMQAFTDRMADTIKREKELAQEQKKGFQVEMLPGFARLKERNPQAYNAVLSAKQIDPEMIDEKGRYKAPAPAATFPKQITKGGKTATVSNQKELDEATGEGWQ